VTHFFTPLKNNAQVFIALTLVYSADFGLG